MVLDAFFLLIAGDALTDYGLYIAQCKLGYNSPTRQPLDFFNRFDVGFKCI